MSYSKQIKRNLIGKRIISSWFLIAVVCMVAGFTVGCVLWTHISTTEIHAVDNADEIVFAVYGAYDGNECVVEMPDEWQSGISDFVPLDVPLDQDLQEFIFCLCDAYRVDFTLVMAVIQQESGFQSNIVSVTNDYGLMQINQMNHRQLTELLGITDYLDPKQNAHAGVFTLRRLFEKYQDTSMVLMAYSMGESAARRLWDEGIYHTEYTDDVMEIQRQFHEQAGEWTDGSREKF